MYEGIITPGIVIAAVLVFGSWLAAKAHKDELAFILLTFSIAFIGS